MGDTAESRTRPTTGSHYARAIARYRKECQATSRSRSRYQRGLTLIELMVVVAIVGILAAIAYPSYVSVVVKNNRAVGRAALTDAAAREQNYYAQYKRYATDLGQLGYPTSTIYVKNDGGLIPNNGGGTPSHAIYLLRVNTALTTTSPPSFRVEAQPTGLQTNDKDCGTLFINAAGSRDSTAGGDQCW